MVEAGAKAARLRRTAWLNGGVSVTMLLVLSALALLVQPPSPPTIAEFAPQANQQIDEAPETPSSITGGSAAAQQETIEVVEDEVVAAEPAPQVTIVEGAPSALTCVTWPDGSVTQTFDPQSPPCIATWDVEAGNGGETSAGVTSTEIRVASPSGDHPWFVEFLNRSYQLYGRRIVLVPFDSAGSGPEAEHADAIHAASLGVFASLEYRERAYSGTYYDELASRGVVTVRGLPTFADSRTLDLHAPFQWVYYPLADELLRATGEVICKQLLGHPAAHSTQYLVTSRRVGVARAERAGHTPLDVTPLAEQLAACGQDDLPVASLTTDTAANRTAMAQLQADGVTTVVLATNSFGSGPNPLDAMLSAAGSYLPEWMLPGFVDQNSTESWQLAPSDQTSALFGVVPWNRHLSASADPAHHVMREHGMNEATIIADDRAGFYRSLALLAAGIQMAGPNLTPQTFADGLAETVFANPGAGAAPSYQATVGFGPGDHTLVNDYALVWWDNAARDPRTGSAGTFCYVDGAKRWRLGDLPANDRFFDPDGATC